MHRVDLREEADENNRRGEPSHVALIESDRALMPSSRTGTDVMYQIEDTE